MKKLFSVCLLVLGLMGLVSHVAAETMERERKCQVEHFIGTGETMALSFSVCNDVIATPTFRNHFDMACQQGLVTYQMKQRPTVKYLRLGKDGSPVHCSST